MDKYKNGRSKRVLINYSSYEYRRAQQLNTKTGKWIAGFDQVIEYGPEDILEDFKSAHREIFNYSRGNGLWLWKPYLIFKTLENLEEGDILVYLDSGAFWVRSAMPIFEILEKEDIYVSDLPLLEKQFSKANLFEALKIKNEQILSNQIQGTIVGIKKCNWTTEFIKGWLLLCCNRELLAPDVKPEGMDQTFIAHREDQSILSCLCKIERIKPHKDPTQYGVLPQKYKGKGFILDVPKHDDCYKPMIALHRSGKCQIKICFNQWLCCMLPVCISEKFIKN